MHFNAVGLPVEAIILRTYERRNLVFSEDLFYDPAWMIMLRLRASSTPLAEQELGTLSGIPGPLLKRWITALLQRGYIGKVEGDNEPAMSAVRYSLTSAAAQKLDAVFHEPSPDPI